jgi:hypothetical protein
MVKVLYALIGMMKREAVALYMKSSARRFLPISSVISNNVKVPKGNDFD